MQDYPENPVPPKEKRGFLKRLKKTFLWSATILVTLAGLISLFGYLYEDKVTSFLVTKLNQRLNTRLETGEVEFSVWKRFPSASVTFSDVKLHGAFPDGFKEDPDTLLQAGELYFSMNLFDLLAGDYSIKSILAENGKINLRFNPAGEGNFNVFTESSSQDETGFDLQEILLQNIFFSYSDSKNGDHINCMVSKAEASGEFLSDDFILSAGIQGTAGEILIAGLGFPVEGKQFGLNGDIRIKGNEKRLSCRDVNLALAAMNYSLEGFSSWAEDGETDLNINGKDLDIQSFLSLLPEEYQEKLSAYTSKGNFFFDASLKGKSKSPELGVDFGVKNGSVSFDGGAPLENLQGTGNFRMTQAGISSMVLSLKDFSGTMQKSSFKGEGSITNFREPVLDLQLEADLLLEEITALFPTDSLPVLKGRAEIDASFKGPLRKKNEYKVSDFVNSKTVGEIHLTDVAVIPMQGNAFTSLNGFMLFDNNDIIVRELNGFIGSSDFFIKGFFRNLVSWFFIPENKLVVDAEFVSKRFYAGELVTGDENTEGNNFNLNFTEKATFYLQAKVDHLTYQKLEAGNLRGKVVLKDKVMKANHLSFAGFSGVVEMAGEADATNPADILLRCSVAAKDIDLKELFRVTDNFGQQQLQDKHLKGRADLDLEFSAAADSTLKMREDEVYASADIVVRNGELIQFEPMNKLSRFVEVEELEHIKFGELRNQVHIRDRKIIIPAMHIQSNALSLDLSGTHSFDNEIDYRFRILMSELVAGKARKARKENDEFGIYEVDEGKRQMALYLAMKGTVENPRFTYDRMGVTDKIKQDLGNEKQTVKSMLNKEFGMFGKDSTLRKTDAPKPVEFEIEWEDEGTKKNEKQDEKGFEEKKDSKFKKWMQKLPGEEVKTEYE